MRFLTAQRLSAAISRAEPHVSDTISFKKFMSDQIFLAFIVEAVIRRASHVVLGVKILCLGKLMKHVLSLDFMHL